MPRLKNAPQAAAPMPAADRDAYWEKRKDAIYLFAARLVCQRFCPAPTSVADVGSNATPVLEWHRGTAKRLVSIDLRKPYVAPGVEPIKADFLEFDARETFDLVTCLQVLEHVPQPAAFAERLLRIADVAVVSVPFKWPKEKCKYHVHDPVDQVKMESWFGRPADFSYVARELTKTARLINVYKRPQTHGAQTALRDISAGGS